MIRVLHVDEDALDLALTRIDIAQISDDIDIDWATSATEALSTLTEYKYDCVISEYYMSDMHGISMLQELRRLGIQIPVIFFSRIRPASSVAEAQEAGATDFLVKGEGYSHYKNLLVCIREAVKNLHKGANEFGRKFEDVAVPSNGNGKRSPGLSEEVGT